MNLTEAYKRLGYELENQRQDWSAENANGICITIWKKEANWHPSPPYMDFFELWPEGGEWTKKPGHSKRIRHLKRAVAEFNGRVDVVLLSGTPGDGYGDAQPWKRPGYVWRITRFDKDSGLFRADVMEQKAVG